MVTPASSGGAGWPGVPWPGPASSRSRATRSSAAQPGTPSASARRRASPHATGGESVVGRGAGLRTTMLPDCCARCSAMSAEVPRPGAVRGRAGLSAPQRRPDRGAVGPGGPEADRGPARRPRCGAARPAVAHRPRGVRCLAAGRLVGTGPTGHLGGRRRGGAHDWPKCRRRTTDTCGRGGAVASRSLRGDSAGRRR